MIDLKEKGWTMYYSCHCGGSLKQYWKSKNHPGYELIIRPTRNTFRLQKKNTTIEGPDWIYNLEQKLTKHGLDS